MARATATKKTSPISVPILPSPFSCPTLISLLQRRSANQVEESAPARLPERGQGVAQPIEAGAVVLLPRGLVRPVDEQRPSLDLVAGQRSPETAVAAVVAVVPEHEQVAGRHHLRTPVVPDALGAEAVLGIVPPQ